jgi:uncharacterized membrane protein YdjX (TVP38/TMEM64 family)
MPPVPADASRASSPARGGLPWRRLALGLVVLAALVAVGRAAGDAVPRFAAWVDSLGALGPAVFVLGYAVAVVAFVPGSLLTLAAGAIFGLLEGTAWVFLAATLGSTAAFLVGRHLARRPIERRLAGDARFAAIDEAIGREGRKIVLLLRLSPVFPFSLLNYALGLTRVRLADYVIGSLGMLPGTLLYVYSGKLAGDVAAAAGGAEVARGTGYWLVIGLGFAATVVVTVLVTRIARRALREATDARVASGRSAPEGAS